MTKGKIGEFPPATLDKLKSTKAQPRRAGSDGPRLLTALAEPISMDVVWAELNAKAQVMYDSTPDKPQKGFLIFRSPGKDIPQSLLELGRLREETFRTVGEGTGNSRDIDEFDQYYDQFIAWDKKVRTITGAYRIGRVDEILRVKGPSGVYTNSLFDLETLLGSDFKEGTLEAGRSFVRPEFQRGLTLVMIWMALARFIVAHPQYKYLMGPVSISNEFRENSKHLMVEYLMKNFPHDKSELVLPKNPPHFVSELSPAEIMAMIDASLNLSELQEFVRHAEDNPRAQIPQLIKLYLELGVRFLAFNKDDEFNSIDGLIWLDVPKVPNDIMSRYMNQEEWTSYRKRHGVLV
jgi:putative hemolysin